MSDPVVPPQPRQENSRCTCGGVLFGDGFSHMRTCPAYEAAAPVVPAERPHPMKEEIDATWKAIERGWDIEPREYFEREAPKNGFKYPLAQAIHHLWKRELKARPAASAADRVSALRLVSFDVAFRLRAEWWTNHGCSLAARYGDDGEMQCHACGIDFLRESLDDLCKHVDFRRLKDVATAKAPALRALVEQWRIYAETAIKESRDERDVAAYRAEAHQRGMAEAFKGAADQLAARLDPAERPKITKE